MVSHVHVLEVDFLSEEVGELLLLFHPLLLGLAEPRVEVHYLWLGVFSIIFRLFFAALRVIPRGRSCEDLAWLVYFRLRSSVDAALTCLMHEVSISLLTHLAS